MSHTIKRVLSALVIVISITAVIIIAFSNPEMKNAWKALASMDLKWVLGLFLAGRHMPGLKAAAHGATFGPRDTKSTWAV
nr:hypothetical protein [uncultured bacterium]